MTPQSCPDCNRVSENRSPKKTENFFHLDDGDGPKIDFPAMTLLVFEMFNKTKHKPLYIKNSLYLLPFLS